MPEGAGRRARALAALVALALAGCVREPTRDAPPPGVVFADRAHLELGGESALPPRVESGDWMEVTLPDGWGLRRRLRATAGWYRVALDVTRQSDEPMALYVRDVRPRGVLFWNGERIAELRSDDHAVVPVMGGASLIPLPSSLIRPGPNELMIRYETDPDQIGIVAPVELGPAELLRARHRIDLGLAAGAQQIFIVVGATLSLLLAVVALRHERSPIYGWLAAGVACWILSSVEILPQLTGLPSGAVRFLRVAAFDAVVPCFLLGLRRALGRGPARGELVLPALVAAHLALRMAVPPVWRVSVDFAGYAMIALLAMHLGALFLRARREGLMTGGPTLALVVLAGLATATHDVLYLLTSRSLVDATLFAFYPACAVTVGSALLGLRLARGLAESEQLNRELERRVSEKHDELQRNYERMRRMEAVRVITEERERWLRDMHDGLGGHLVSTLALVESGDAPSAQVADALRDALDELRVLIDSVDPDEPDLLVALATLRSRLEPRLARAGLRFDWRVHDLPALAGEEERVVLQTLRIVQEAVTNVAKHAGATTITIAAGEGVGPDGRRGGRIEVRDDGRGMPAAPRVGRGLRNMQRRAQEIGARLEVATGSSGTRVSLWIPAREGDDARGGDAGRGVERVRA